MEIFEHRFGRDGKGGRYNWHETGSRVFGLDPVQDLGVRAMTFYRGNQRGFPSIRVRKEDVSKAE